MKFKNNILLISLAVLALFVGLSCVSAEDGNGTHDFSLGGLENPKINEIKDLNLSEISPDDDASTFINNTAKPCDESDVIHGKYSSVDLDENNDFNLSVKYDANSDCHWVVSESYGADYLSHITVVNYPDRTTGTTYYFFHVTGEHFHVTLSLFDSEGHLIDEVTAMG